LLGLSGGAGRECFNFRIAGEITQLILGTPSFSVSSGVSTLNNGI
jgi:hypothetical protein